MPDPRKFWEMFKPPAQNQTQRFPVPGDPDWDPNTLANRWDEPSVMEPKWMSVARKMGQGLGQLGEMGKGLITGGGEEAGPTAENLGGMLQAALPFAGPAGFYSRVNRVAEGVPKQIHPNKLMALLKSGASQEEVAYRGLPDFISGHGNNMISRDDLFKYLTEHQAPEVGVVRKTGPEKVIDRTVDAVDDDLYGLWESSDPTKYSAYQVPGGENYRETLMTLPDKYPQAFDQWSKLKSEFDEIASHAPLRPPEAVAETKLLLEQLQQKMDVIPGIHDNPYISPHWDEPNVLVHGRGQDYRLPTNKPLSVDDLTNPQRHSSGVWTFDAPNANPPIEMGIAGGNTQEEAAQSLLKNYSKHGRTGSGPSGHLVENVQSDWHQTGRKEGYRQPGAYDQLQALHQEYRTNAERVSKLWDELDFSRGAIAPETYPPKLVQLLEKQSALQERIHQLAPSVDAPPDAPFKDTWPDLQLKQHILDAANDPKAEWIGVTQSKELRRRGETISPEFQDKRLPNTIAKLLAPFGGDPHISDVPLRTDIPEAARAWIARLTPEMKAKIKASGFPLMTIALLATQGQDAQQPGAR